VLFRKVLDFACVEVVNLDISGIPGTGKTATFKAVLRQLQAEMEAEELDPFEYVEINGMKLSEPKQAYSVLYEGLTTERVTPSHAEHLLLTRFTSLNPDQRPCLVLMDELDMLVTQKQSIVYNFFEWPNLPYSRLIVVAIANTMDLPERMLSNKVSSRLGLTRMTFQPYTHKQLTEIVESRLQGLNVMSDDAIQLCARRVSSVCGDARRCLDVSRYW
jgi:Cdc6-like AAA superfamily ATPase